ncbi:hypothetical protein D3C71_1127430 [compost metagenome]
MDLRSGAHAVTGLAGRAQELPEQVGLRKQDFVVGRRPPARRQGLPESIEQILGEGVEGHRIEAAGMLALAALGDTQCEVTCCVALERNGEDALGSGAGVRLQQVRSALSEQFGLACTRTGQHRSMARGTDDLQRIALQPPHAHRRPGPCVQTARRQTHSVCAGRRSLMCCRILSRHSGMSFLRVAGDT